MVKNHNKSWQFTGQSSFLTDLEIKELEKHISMVLLTFRKLIKDGKILLLEWSFAYDSNVEGKAVGNPYLIFYEVRSI